MMHADSIFICGIRCLQLLVYAVRDLCMLSVTETWCLQLIMLFNELVTVVYEVRVLAENFSDVNNWLFSADDFDFRAGRS